MSHHDALENSVDALLARHSSATTDGRSFEDRLTYGDVQYELAGFRADRSDERARDLAIAADRLIDGIGDMCWADSPEWEAAYAAVDPYVR